jgi:hypothetical protein
MRRFVFLAVALVVSFLAGGILLNGYATRAADDAKPAVKYRGVLYRNWRRLGLTDQQVQKIYQIQAEHRAKIAALQAQIDQLKDEERIKAEGTLTTAQKSILREQFGGLVSDKVKPTTSKPIEKPKPTEKKPDVKKNK